MHAIDLLFQFPKLILSIELHKCAKLYLQIFIVALFIIKNI